MDKKEKDLEKDVLQGIMSTIEKRQAWNTGTSAPQESITVEDLTNMIDTIKRMPPSPKAIKLNNINHAILISKLQEATGEYGKLWFNLAVEIDDTLLDDEIRVEYDSKQVIDYIVYTKDIKFLQKFIGGDK